MNLNSIITRITFIFIFAIVLLTAVFFFYVKYEKEQKNTQISSYHENLSNYLMNNKMPRFKVIEYFETLNFSKEENPFIVIDEGLILTAKRGFETIEYKKEYFFHIVTPRFRLLFKDLTKYEDSFTSYIFFAIFLLLLISIYIWLFKSLYPLNELKNNIVKFSQGDLTIDCKSNKKDEIAEVSNEFNNAVKKIKLLLDSRQLFLRTVMHELKTPIAKGRIVSELVEDEKQKNRMVTIFEKLDFLINDFAKIEEVISKNYEIKKHDYFIDEIIKNSTSMLILDNQKEKIKLDISQNDKIKVDFELMSMVFKNLIDNALRYSSDNKVLVKQNGASIEFISKGEKLKKPFEDYFTPFHNDTNSNNHGMGLGLYIVKSILDMHKMKFEYEYYEETNIFKIIK